MFNRATRLYATIASQIPSQNMRELDRTVLKALSRSQQSFGEIARQSTERADKVLPYALPYESRPVASRRASLAGIVLVAHCVRNPQGDHKVTVCSGFAIENRGITGGNAIITCAHTLQELRRSSLAAQDNLTSGSFVLAPRPDGTMMLSPVSEVLSALPRYDLLLLKTADLLPIATLPISPYPAPRDTAIQLHLVAHDQPPGHGWTRWTSEIWQSWPAGRVLGYRDFAGREAQPGSYDSLANMFISTLPTPGSSGGPIIEESSGTVIGVVLGTRMDSRIEGVRGWGVPAETIYEMFSLQI
ncbi:hypothetical protein MKEN_00806300 [Mycena kentingensis (nom. inval.)]|nr:hypothetical protein MKEN_00806300 [Mycena kentingensis (nom. inval.)]